MASSRVVALVAAAIVLMACSASAQPKEACMKTIVLAENFDINGMVIPAGLNLSKMDEMDVFVGHNVGFYNPLVFGGSGESTRKAGMSNGYCYYFGTDGPANYGYCSTTLIIYYDERPIGSLTFLGPFPDFTDSEFESAIAGGTGWFVGASGMVQVHVKKGGALYKYTIKLDMKSKFCK